MSTQLQQFLFLMNWYLGFFIFTCLSRFQSGSLSSDVLSLMSLMKVNESVCLSFFSCPEKGSGDFHALYMSKPKLKVDLNLFFMSTVKQQDFKTSCPVPACMHAKSLKSYLTLHNTVAHQAPLLMGFSRQEYCSGLPRPPLGDLPGPGTEPPSPANLALHVDSLPLSHWGSPVQSLLAS